MLPKEGIGGGCPKKILEKVAKRKHRRRLPNEGIGEGVKQLENRSGQQRKGYSR